MAETLATKKQSEAIRQEMQHVRNRLPHDVDRAKARARQLSDWKYHMRRRPWPVLAVAAAAGYLLIPHKRSTHKEVVVHQDTGGMNPPAKKGLIGGAVGALATMALRSGTTMAARYASEALFNHKSSSSGDRRRAREPEYQTHP